MNRFWFQAPVTEIAQRINDLSAMLLVVILAIMAIVFAIMIWSIARHRRSVGHAAATFTGNRFFETLWTVVPILIVPASCTR